ncbi:uncharacterized protein LOC124448362 [Xenia sp. Carnegie-2017]|uniref:uncharacterized protein LOC124448362 n=1 Tax=Xenia sp. Carnegie-2017 TaxID=2897299 RepID=UPI001F04015A|nr:uncharacterized protein LOC124448362 [Xenia sp. Carnegie-2017]
MMLKIIFFTLAITTSLASAGWNTIASNLCVKPSNDQYKEFTFSGSSTFIIAVRLKYVSGKIGCHYTTNTNWGCHGSGKTINMIITDTRNKRIFPSPTFVTPGTGNWYELPGYTENSSSLTFDVPGYKWLYNGQNSEFGTEKIWQAIQKATIVDKLVWM